MSDLVRSGYTARPSPSAMLSALALNAGAVALVIALPMTFAPRPKTPPMHTTWIPLSEPPRPVEEPLREPIDQPVAKNTTPPDQPTVLDTPFDALAAGLKIAVDTPPVIPGLGERVEPRVPIVEPVFIKARPDPRFAGAFHPNYPPSLVREGVEGDVTVRVTIDARGRVIAVEMVKASNPVFFEETRRQALRSWRFVAATRDGVAVESVQTMTVHFRLET